MGWEGRELPCCRRSRCSDAAGGEADLVLQALTLEASAQSAGARRLTGSGSGPQAPGEMPLSTHFVHVTVRAPRWKSSGPWNLATNGMPAVDQSRRHNPAPTHAQHTRPSNSKGRRKEERGRNAMQRWRKKISHGLGTKCLDKKYPNH